MQKTFKVFGGSYIVASQEELVFDNLLPVQKDNIDSAILEEIEKHIDESYTFFYLERKTTNLIIKSNG